jgi:hypothetical protein
MTDTILRYLVLAAAVVQIVYPYFVNPFRDGAQPLRGNDPSQIEPAGYAFAIWGPIYLLAVVYAIWQLTPSGRATPETTRIAPLAIMLYAGSSVWLAAAQYGPLWPTMPVLAIMAVCAVLALKLGTDVPNPSWQQVLCLILPFGLYAGWTVCATFVNVAEVAPAYGFTRFGLSVSGYAVLSLAALTVLVGLILQLTQGNLAFAGTVAWALIGIIVAAWTRPVDNTVPVAAGVALAAIIILAATLRLRERAWD